MSRDDLVYLFTAVEMIRHSSWGLENAVSHAKGYVNRLMDIVPEKRVSPPLGELQAIPRGPLPGQPQPKRRGRPPANP